MFRRISTTFTASHSGQTFGTSRPSLFSLSALAISLNTLIHKVYADEDDITRILHDGPDPEYAKRLQRAQFISNRLYLDLFGISYPGFKYFSTVTYSPSDEDLMRWDYNSPAGIHSFFIADGEDGKYTQLFVASNLNNTILEALGELWPQKRSPPTSECHEAIRRAFRRIDDDIIYGSTHDPLPHFFAHPGYTPTVDEAHSSASVLYGMYDSTTRRLHIANAGTNRAVLGRHISGSSGHKRYDLQVLSTDHVFSNPQELNRIRSEHPGEELDEIGIHTTRFIGGGLYKWSRQLLDRLFTERLIPFIHENWKSPPYVTAEPDIISVEVQPQDFLIIGSKGLWDSLTNEEAVSLVDWWIRRYRENSDTSANILRPDDLPIKGTTVDETVTYKRWEARKQFVCKDDDVAVHLARNALGGADEALTSWLLSPYGSRWRDDISVGVILFTDDENSAEMNITIRRSPN